MVNEPNTNDGIFSLHKSVWILLIIAFLVLVVILYLSGSRFDCGMDGEKFVCGFTKHMKFQEKDMTGYYYSLDEKGETFCSKEKFNIKFYEDKITVLGHSVGDSSEKDGTPTAHRWIQSGYRHGNNISLAYVEDSNSPSGAGVYYLMENGSEYSGFWLGKDFPLGHKVQCPYVLTARELSYGVTCEQRWPKVFNENSVCKILNNR